VAPSCIQDKAQSRALTRFFSFSRYFSVRSVIRWSDTRDAFYAAPGITPCGCRGQIRRARRLLIDVLREPQNNSATQLWLGFQLKNPANLDTQLGSQRGYEDAQTFKSALQVSKLAELEPARDSEPAGAGSCVRYIKRITKKMSNMTANMAASTRWRLLMLNLETAAFPSFSDTRIEYNQGTDNIILVSGVLFQ
jgi:hypothetical protein